MNSALLNVAELMFEIQKKVNHRCEVGISLGPPNSDSIPSNPSLLLVVTWKPTTKDMAYQTREIISHFNLQSQNFSDEFRISRFIDRVNWDVRESYA